MALAPLAAASDVEVDKHVQTQSTVQRKDFDGYICELGEGDKMEWTVSFVSGDALNVHLMPGSEYEKLKQGKNPVYFSQYSRDRTEFYSDGFNATGTLVGSIVLVVLTQGDVNSTSTYDIEIELTAAKGPQNVLDMLCGLGIGMCALLILGAVVLLFGIYYVFKRFSGAIEDRPDKEERPEAKGVDGMMRPGFNVVIGPSAEPPKPKGKKGKPKPSKGRTPARTVPARPKGPIRCPGCGEKVDPAQGFCQSCGADLG